MLSAARGGGACFSRGPGVDIAQPHSIIIGSHFMKSGSLSSALLVLSLAVAPLASAQSMDSLKDRAGDMLSGQSSASGGSMLGSLSSGAFHLGSMQNVAGVLGYCQKQGYTKSKTEMVKEKLMGKLGGEQEAEQDIGYQQGLKGVLQGENGQGFNLSSLKDQVGEKACGLVADRAMSSFLGG